MGKHNVLMWWKTSTFFSIWFKSFLSPSAKEVCEGYVFTRVCYSVHRDGLQAIPTGEVGWSGWGVFRPRPKGVYRPREVSRATPLGVQAQAGGVYPSMHWNRHPPERWPLLRTVCILLEYILVPLILSNNSQRWFSNEVVRHLQVQRGAPGTCPLEGPNSFIFMQFSAKIWKIIAILGVGAPPRENPRSTTVFHSFF